MTERPSPSDRGPLLAWQLELYPNNHADRRNLILHVLTVPLFMLGGVALVVGVAALDVWIALAGLAAMPVAMALQARGHRLETTPPVPFRGPGDVVARIFAEQWLTFPRFVLAGGFARAWRAAKAQPGSQ
ncbi:terminase [Nannocystaceae bacterium ST9]